MHSPFSSILRGVNRDRSEPLRILCGDTHEAYQTILARTGHLFYSLSRPGWKKWDCRFRPLPWNYQPLAGQSVAEQLKPDMTFDLVLSQHKFGQYQVLSQVAATLNCPLICVEHTLPQPGWKPEQVEAFRRMRGDINVYLSAFSVGAWECQPDPSLRIVEMGVDTDFFQGWEGGDGRILTVQNQYAQRGDVLGFDIYRRVTDGLPVHPVGDSPGLSKPANGEEHLRSIYRRAAVFLNTTTWSTCPVALLEAMAVGCPVVTTATTMLPDIVQDGVNGYCTNNEAEMRMRLQELLKNPQRGRELGEAARRTVIERFGADRFVANWNQVFFEAVDTPALTWMRG